MTNWKSHTRFRFVPKSMALDDLEGPLRAVYVHLSIGAHHENFRGGLRGRYQRRRCSPMTRFWQYRYKVYADIRDMVLKIYVNFP